MIRPMNMTSHGRFVPWTFRPMNDTSPCHPSRPWTSFQLWYTILPTLNITRRDKNRCTEPNIMSRQSSSMRRGSGVHCSRGRDTSVMGQFVHGTHGTYNPSDGASNWRNIQGSFEPRDEKSKNKYPLIHWSGTFWHSVSWLVEIICRSINFKETKIMSYPEYCTY
jgi:hypothetical protein